MTDPSFAPFEEKMRAAQLPPIAISTFAHYYRLIQNGETGLLPEKRIEPVETLDSSADISCSEASRTKALSKAVVVKLNGGLGTSMGMAGAKTLLPVKQGLSFLDVIARQVLELRKRHNCSLPLVLMNSYRTRDDSLAALQTYPTLPVTGVPLDFVQHKVPRIQCDDLQPLRWPDDPGLEWCPPGHGDLYVALHTSGMLDALLAQDFEYAFVSNGDNLGAVLDLDVLGWFAEQELPFVMEVAERTENDRKGGHLARLKSGGLVLRESAQCPADETDFFQDISRYRFFNTNNLWVNLKQLRAALDAHDQVLPLPLIRNQRSVVAADRASPKVYQTETAMGAAISVFEGARALSVPRERFAPVKTTNELLLLWSDRYHLDQASRLLPDPDATERCIVELDARYFGMIDDFQARFAAGVPSMRRACGFRVNGDVCFGADVTVEGEVELTADPGTSLRIEDGARLAG